MPRFGAEIRCGERATASHHAWKPNRYSIERPKCAHEIDKDIHYIRRGARPGCVHPHRTCDHQAGEIKDASLHPRAADVDREGAQPCGGSL